MGVQASSRDEQLSNAQIYKILTTLQQPQDKQNLVEDSFIQNKIQYTFSMGMWDFHKQLRNVGPPLASVNLNSVPMPNATTTKK